MTAARTHLLEYLASATKATVTRVRAKLSGQYNDTVTAGPPDAVEAGRVHVAAGGDGVWRPD